MANSTNTENLEKICARLAGEFQGGKFDPFIQFIEFPNYKNFQKGMRVNFEFPLTVIVGQNGTGKSSILQAMYGAPRGLQPGRWWFGTALDPMEDDELIRTGKRKKLKTGDKAAFWYQYTTEGNTFEAVKMRVRRAGDPDYWEPSKPIKSFGMAGERENPVSMDAIYLNFKTQINAFDRCFYFNAPDAIKKVGASAHWRDIKASFKRRKERIQDYLRWRSTKLRKVLIDGQTIKFGKYEFHKNRVELSPSELEDISWIVGRTYNSGFLVEHRFYETWGTSVMFNTEERSYSDAFAGSGESSVVRLVHEIYKSENGRMVLLDEPETSLHPGAQERLLHFLLRETSRKKLQVVVSTHSPAFIRHLPTKSIRVFSLDAEGHVKVAQDVNAEEAFFVLGHPTESLIQLVVEDRLSKQIIDAVIEQKGEAFSSQFETVYRPGGETAMKKDAAIRMYDDDVRQFFIFDGDLASYVVPENLAVIPIDVSPEQFDEAIKDWLNVKITFRQDSNTTDDAKVQIRKKFVDFAKKTFKCLPFQTPEEAIWKDACALALLEAVGAGTPELESVNEADCFKTKFKELAELTQPDGHSLSGSNIQAMHGIFVNRFCKDEGAVFQAIKEMLEGIADNA